ncbi:hypothetical protein AAFA46_09640 [Oscillospiraceae bacterium WX1]
MKNAHDRRLENKKVKQLEINVEPSSGGENDRQNKNHNTKKVSMGPNTKR